MSNDRAAAQSSSRLDRRGGEFDADCYASPRSATFTDTDRSIASRWRVIDLSVRGLSSAWRAAPSEPAIGYRDSSRCMGTHLPEQVETGEGPGPRRRIRERR